jgi:hypothetical protein
LISLPLCHIFSVGFMPIGDLHARPRSCEPQS